jgi:hypothetical protein
MNPCMNPTPTPVQHPMNRRSGVWWAAGFCSLAVWLSGCGPAPGYEPVHYPEPPQPVPGSITNPAPPRDRVAEDMAQITPAGYQGNDPNGGVPLGSDEGSYADTDPAALTEFREPLAPYGTWVDDPTHGTVWVPHTEVVGNDFVPYQTAGHWTYDDEYVWVSDYSWGWAPFHYGRWVHVGYRGWAWIPGRRYAGAWVVWRTGPVGFGYVGWAPMAPTWYWHAGYPYAYYAPPAPRYVYCPRGDVFHPAVGGRVVAGGAHAEAEAGTRPYVPAQPSVGAVARTPAQPTVDGRTPAQPSVGGRTPAQPGVGGRRLAKVDGPDPSRDLGVASLPPPPRDNPGLVRAAAYADPVTAKSYGARAPMGQASRAEPVAVTAFAPPARPSRIDAAATAPRYQGIEPRPQPAAPSAPTRFQSVDSAPRYEPPRFSDRAAYSPPTPQAPRSPAFSTPSRDSMVQVAPQPRASSPAPMVQAQPQPRFTAPSRAASPPPSPPAMTRVAPPVNMSPSPSPRAAAVTQQAPSISRPSAPARIPPAARRR